MRRTGTILTLVIAMMASSCGDDVSVFELGVGDCFDDVVSDSEIIESVPVVPCDEPHDNEIYYEFSMTGAAFPGVDQAVETSYFRCLEEFDGFVGLDYLDSELDLFPITPTADSWEQGDRVVYCSVFALDLSKLTGSMRGSRR